MQLFLEVAIMKTFAEKLVARRAELGLSQAQLGELAGIGKRTITSYETDGRLPHATGLYRLAKALDVSPEYLKNEEIDDPHYGQERADYVEDARRRFGAAGARDVERLVAQNAALFAGGELSPDDMDEMMKAIQDAYWIAKEKNRKYAKG